MRTRGKETATESEELCPSVLSCCGCGKRVCPMGGVRAGGLHVLGGAQLGLPFWKCHQPFITWELRQRTRNIIHEGRSCSPARLFLPAQSKGSWKHLQSPFVLVSIHRPVQACLGFHRVFSKSVSAWSFSELAVLRAVQGDAQESLLCGLREKGLSYS